MDSAIEVFCGVLSPKMFSEGAQILVKGRVDHGGSDGGGAFAPAKADVMLDPKM